MCPEHQTRLANLQGKNSRAVKQENAIKGVEFEIMVYTKKKKKKKKKERKEEKKRKPIENHVSNVIERKERTREREEQIKITKFLLHVSNGDVAQW